MTKKYEISEEERARRSEQMRERNADPEFRRAQAEARERKRAEGITGLVPSAAPGPEPDQDVPIDLLAEYRKIVRDPKATPKQRSDALREVERLESERGSREATLETVLEHLRAFSAAVVAKIPFEEIFAGWDAEALERGYLLSYEPLEPEPLEPLNDPGDVTEPPGSTDTDDPDLYLPEEDEPDLETIADALPVVAPSPPAVATGPLPVRDWGPNDGTGASPERFGERPSY